MNRARSHLPCLSPFLAMVMLPGCPIEYTGVSGALYLGEGVTLPEGHHTLEMYFFRQMGTLAWLSPGWTGCEIAGDRRTSSVPVTESDFPLEFYCRTTGEHFRGSLIAEVDIHDDGIAGGNLMGVVELDASTFEHGDAEGIRLELQPLPVAVFVDASATGAADGTSWEDAYTDLGEALDAHDPRWEIWVASGTYRPRGGREDSFVVVDGTILLGGFAGTEDRSDQRDWLANPTTLSGDIGTPGDPTDNVKRVLYVSTDYYDLTVVDGFTITGAWSSPDDDTYPHGGGIEIHGSPIIRNCVIEDNVARFGGGVHVGWGEPWFIDTAFAHNSADLGGGLAFSGGNGLVLNSVFNGNVSEGRGGAIYVTHASAHLAQVTMTSNSSKYGAGIGLFLGNARLENSILWNNQSTEFGEIWDYECGDDLSCTAQRAIVGHAIVEGGFPGANVLADDPAFVDPEGADGVSGTTDDDLRLSSGSPAIDAGNDLVVDQTFRRAHLEESADVRLENDFDGLPRVAGTSVDLGAFERQ